MVEAVSVDCGVLVKKDENVLVTLEIGVREVSEDADEDPLEE